MLATRRALIASAGAGIAALHIADASAKTSKTHADFLFVQTAKAMSFDKATNTLTLDGVSPITVMFSDRPQRIAANMKTSAFVPFWSKGKDSFLADAPNADVSIVDGDKLLQVVATLSNPVLAGEKLTYAVKILQGTFPEKGNDVSVFIDIIGMPLTPMSYAGFARRGFRRGFYR